MSIESETWLSRLQKIAYHDWLCARLLFNVGYYDQAYWMINQSMEKYMKVLWAKEYNKESICELKKKIKKLSRNHDLQNILTCLNKNYRDKLNKFKIIFYKPSVLRYGEYEYGLGFSNKMFRKCEKFIKQIRIFLSDIPNGRILDEYEKSIHVSSNEKRKKAIEYIKGILSLGRYMPTKKERRKTKHTLAYFFDNN